MNKLYALLMALFIFIPTPSRSQSSDVPESSSRVIDITGQVQAMIEAGYHQVTDHGQGMSAQEYRAIWGETVEQPSEYAGRFDSVLLVDRTIDLHRLLALTKGLLNKSTETDYYLISAKVKGEERLCFAYQHRGGCKEKWLMDFVSPPYTNLSKDIPKRYVVYFQDGQRYLSQTVRQVQSGMPDDEVGLTALEGLHLVVQYSPQPQFRKGSEHLRAMILAGTHIFSGNRESAGGHVFTGPDADRYLDNDFTAQVPVLVWFDARDSRQVIMHTDFTTHEKKQFAAVATRGGLIKTVK
ncbi:hypothetical protein KKG19_03880 [Patescibacteria group bacterium]|nr:hypothetical protein [Patescibacteria group bacterium]